MNRIRVLAAVGALLALVAGLGAGLGNVLLFELGLLAVVVVIAAVVLQGAARHESGMKMLETLVEEQRVGSAARQAESAMLLDRVEDTHQEARKAPARSRNLVARDIKALKAQAAHDSREAGALIERALADVATAGDVERVLADVGLTARRTRNLVSQAVLESAANARRDLRGVHADVAARLGAQDKRLVGMLGRQRDLAQDHTALLRRALAASVVDTADEVDAAMQLHRLVSPRGIIPPSGGWAMSSRGILDVVTAIMQSRPKLIVELGSGTSTVWLAHAAEQVCARLIAIEHMPDWADLTRSRLRGLGLDAVAEVRLAPLEDQLIDDKHAKWYAAEALEGLDGIDVLLVDGPPKRTGAEARRPALPRMASLLSDRAIIFLDDADRSDEQAAMDAWQKQWSGLQRGHTDTARLAVFSWQR